MRLNWISMTDEDMASFRYHILIPSRELQLMGHETVITPTPVIDADRYIFSKHFNYGDYWSLEGLKAHGKYTVYHCCDNHFGGIHDGHYRRMIRSANSVICTTQVMKKEIENETGISPILIPETYEMVQCDPSFNKGDVLKVLWFGHSINMRALQKELPLPDGCELRMVTKLTDKNGNIKRLPLEFDKVPWTAWSIESLNKALEWCDCVILPVLMDRRDLGRSHNRLVESVRRGKFVIASPLDSYLEFKDFMYIGNIHEGLEWLKNQEKDDIEERIKSCQVYIENKYNPKKIGELWQKALQ